MGSGEIRVGRSLEINKIALSHTGVLSMTRVIRYGILGCGMMGQEHLRNLALIEGAEVVAIAESDPQMRELASQLAPTATMYDAMDELLDDPNIDALVIATPNYQHAEQLLTIFSRTQLPILVEKPVITQLDQVLSVKQAADAHPAPVWVAMEYRYMPPIIAFKKHLDAGDIGNLTMLSIREHRFPFLKKVNDWNRFNVKSGGTLVEKCCHFFDLMRLLTEDEVVQVYASAGQDNNHLEENYQGETPDILDNAFVVLDFASGKRAMLDLNMFAEGSRYQEEICASGSTGKLECFVPGPGRFWPTEALGPAPIAKIILSPRQPKGPIESDIPVDPTLLEAGDHNGSTYYQHQGFYRAVSEGGAVEVTVDDGLKAVVIGLAAQHSVKTGQAVKLTENGLSFS
jgi:predicted dehydrogenase